MLRGDSLTMLDSQNMTYTGSVCFESVDTDEHDRLVLTTDEDFEQLEALLASITKLIRHVTSWRGVEGPVVATDVNVAWSVDPLPKDGVVWEVSVHPHLDMDWEGIVRAEVAAMLADTS
jgi:hypothetical protein